MRTAGCQKPNLCRYPANELSGSNISVAHHPKFRVILAQTTDDLRAAQRLRYDVFVQEMAGNGPLVDHEARLERDAFDDHAGHFLLMDDMRDPGDQTVGVYRFMTKAMAETAGQFYCEDEYDLTVLRQSGKGLLELGRSCLHRDYRSGVGMLHLWSALSDYVVAQNIEILFGVASFHGTDIANYAQPLGLLHQRHLAPKALRVVAKGPTAFSLDQVRGDQLDRLAAVKAMPALIKAYLRLGGTVGEGAFVDHEFNTVDICIVLERAAINQMQQTIYAKGTSRG